MRKTISLQENPCRVRSRWSGCCCWKHDERILSKFRAWWPSFRSFRSSCMHI